MSESLMRDNLIVCCQIFASAKGLTMTTVSKKIHGSGGFLDRFVKGDSSPSVRQYFAMLERLREIWPDDLEWPKTSPIPAFEASLRQGVEPRRPKRPAKSSGKTSPPGKKKTRR